jgi:ankyrin repeat protein
VHHVIQGAAKKQKDVKIADKYSQTLKLLLSHGANVNSCNYWGETALHKACSLGLDDAVEITA